MMKPLDRSPTLRRGFTLIELITVMAILGILVALVVGVARGVRDEIARKATQEILAALDSALQGYVADYGKYPWFTTTGVMGQVADSVVPSGLSASWEYREEAILYAALAMSQRHGPYITGVGGAVVTPKDSSGKAFPVFGDGWKRPIRYKLPKAGAISPLLESLGVKEADDNDNITNY